MSAPRDGLVLALDTATSRAVVALGTADGSLVDADAWDAGHRHSEELLARIAALLARAGLAGPAGDALAGVVVGTGPGGFTGLRVGLATAHGIARGAGVPLVGIPSGVALEAAARASGRVTPEAAIAILLPAGPAGRYVVRDGAAALAPAALAPAGIAAGPADPSGEPAGGALEPAPPDAVLVAVDLPGRAPAPALELGAAALDGLAAALVGLGAARLRAGVDAGARVEPVYVTLPRGAAALAGEVAWSRVRP